MFISKTNCHFFPTTALFVYLLVQKGVVAVQITRLTVPESVQNGSRSGVVLDCEYTLRPDELSPESGLVIKWFFNNSQTPIYQWIPRQKPQVLGIFKGRLKLNYQLSPPEATMNRALHIINPTTELSGDYKCSVSTFDDEDFMIKHMIVYAPEKKLELVQSKPGLETVNISCTAQGVYPEPQLALVKDPDRKDSMPLKGAVVETTSRSGVYDITASIVINDEELQRPTTFGCIVSIPSTSYVNKKSILYYPGQALPWTDSGTRAHGQGTIIWLISIAIWLFFSFHL